MILRIVYKILLIALVLSSSHVDAFSPIQQNTIYTTTDRILDATDKQVTHIKQSVIMIKEHLQLNYLPLSVVEVWEEVVRNLVPYLQCPSLDCLSPDPLCEYNQQLVDERGCTTSCGELTCTCDQVDCLPIPAYCDYADQTRDAQGCLLQCGTPQCDCPITSCPQDDQCQGAIYDQYGCIQECVPQACEPA